MRKGKVGSSRVGKALSPASPEPRKGRAFTFVQTDRGFFPLQVLKNAEIRKARGETPEKRTASKQLKSDKAYMMERNLVPPPFSRDGLLGLQENNCYFDACVRQIAKDVAGLGYDVVLKEGLERGSDEDLRRIKAFLDDPNADEDTIDDVLDRAIQDWGVIGAFALEVHRTPGSSTATLDSPSSRPSITGLYQIPAHTVLVHQDGNKFCQMVGPKRVWFKRFGYEKDIDLNNGDEREPGSIPEERRAKELIYYKNYYARSSWYGAPNILPSVGAIKAQVGVRDYNLAFFENYGVPAALVALDGDWDDDAIKAIMDFLDAEIRGTNNQHKTIVLNPPEGGKVTWTPLITEVKEGHFKLYGKSLRDETLVCYRMPPYRVGINETGSLGGTNSPEATKIYVDSVVNPLKRVLNSIITRKIVAAGIGSVEWEFRLKPVDTRDEDAISTRCATLFGIGALTRNDIREQIGKPQIDPEVDPMADEFYIATNYAPVNGPSAPPETADLAIAGAVAKMEAEIGRLIKASKKRRPERSREDDGD